MTVTGSLREGGARDPAASAARGGGGGTDGGGAATPAVHDIGSGAAMVDLHHQGSPSIIGVGVLELPAGGVALVDPGPEARLHALRDGLAALGRTLEDVRAILLTHIHLDHATAAGAIVREAPGAVVHVHAVGAPHMADPSRLLASAGRIYGDAMATLWGEFLPVPRESIRVVDEGDAVAPGGRRFEVAYVPGHAKHHVAYCEAATGTAWVGDVGGIRIRGGPAIPVTPPPDIDVALWKASMDRVTAWRPERIVATHFGPYGDVEAHFAELAGELDAWALRVRESLNDDAFANDHERARAFSDWVARRVAEQVSPAHTELYGTASGFFDSWWGLARYWRKRGAA
ncbi:MAG: MBL fold metallo-hydrolase [Gemmatimonadetes bacterium]|nr:MBL fold metallo-hydrolase [Gemmatimonadota bacterium]